MPSAQFEQTIGPFRSQANKKIPCYFFFLNEVLAPMPSPKLCAALRSDAGRRKGGKNNTPQVAGAADRTEAGRAAELGVPPEPLPSLFSRMLGANPPSSPTLVASFPYFSLMTFFRLWYTSAPMRMASVKFAAPTGRIMNSCMASLLPA